MTLAETLARAEKEIDAILLDAEIRAEDMLRDHGATHAELEAVLIDHRASAEQWKAEHMRKIESWLRRGGNSEH